MNNLIDFFSFQDPNVRYVVLGSILLSASSAMVGCFSLLKKKALVGDAVAHSVLPGICAAFLFSSSKDVYLLIPGAFITGWLSLILIDYIVANSKIKKDTAIGLILSVFFGVGIVMLTSIQQSGNVSQSGLDSFIFGNAATLIGKDLVVFGVIGVILVLAIALFFKEFSLIAFDEAFAKTIGLPTRKLDLFLTTLTVLAVVTGITAVGVILMAAMLITPGSAARYWTSNIKRMVALAALFGAVSGIAGAYISFTAPAMPTGPWMVVVSSMIALFSFFIAPQKGIIAKWYTQRKNRHIILEENVLKIFYHLGEQQQNFEIARELQTLAARRALGGLDVLKRTLFRLQVKGYVVQAESNAWRLSRKGIEKASRVVKLHRLWELYLTNYMKIAPDHVHDDAETIEHIITPELEQELEAILNYPGKDPHQQSIPRLK